MALIDDIKQVMDEQQELYEGTTFFENPEFASAIVGSTEEGRLVYSYELMIESMIANGEAETIEDAIEWLDFNTLRTIPYMGPKAPIIVYSLPV